MDAQRKYWKVDEANTPAQKKISPEEQTDDIENKTYLIDDEALSEKIVEHISQQKRQQQIIFDEFIRIHEIFQKI